MEKEIYEILKENETKLLIQENCLFLNEATFMQQYMKFVRKSLTFALGRPESIVSSNLTYLRMIKKEVKNIKTKEEKEKVIAKIEKNLRGFKRNRTYWINKSNILPGVDKKIKEKSIDSTISNLEELLEEVKKLKV